MANDTMGKTDLLRVESEFLYNASFNLSQRGYDLLFYLISKLEPGTKDNAERQTDFFKTLTPLTEVYHELNTSGQKWGNFYIEMEKEVNNLGVAGYSFPKWYKMIDPDTGKRVQIKGKINWFQSILLIKDEKGNVFIEHELTNKLKYYLLNLEKWVLTTWRELFYIKGGVNKHLYHILKAKRRQMNKGSFCEFRVEFLELKRLLGLAGKYEKYKEFNRRVLQPAKKNIENSPYSNISFNASPGKEGRKTKYVDFIIYDLDKTKKIHQFVNREIKEEDVLKLTKAKEKAYQVLVNFGVKKTIALYTIIPSITGGVVEGYEDYFIQYAIDHFKQKAKQKNAATFVTWWTQRKSFDVKEGGEEWAKFNEKIAAIRKKLQENNMEIYDNRLLAKKMTKKEFEDLFTSEKMNREIN